MSHNKIYHTSVKAVLPHRWHFPSPPPPLVVEYLLRLVLRGYSFDISTFVKFSWCIWKMNKLCSLLLWKRFLYYFVIIFVWYAAMTSDFKHIELSLSCVFITLRTRQNGRHFPDDIFKCIFLNENIWILIKISLKLVPNGSINNIPALVHIMAWRRPGLGATNAILG